MHLVMVPTWIVLPKLTHTELPTEKVISNSRLHQWGPQVPFQWSQGSSHGIAFPQRNLRKKPSLTSTDLLFLHDFFTWLGHLQKVFSPLIFKRNFGSLNCHAQLRGESIQCGWWEVVEANGPCSRADWQSLLLISSVLNNNLYIFWSINFLDSNNSAQLKRCSFFLSSEAADHKLNVC